MGVVVVVEGAIEILERNKKLIGSGARRARGRE
jgi:hypothetical protein